MYLIAAFIYSTLFAFHTIGASFFACGVLGPVVYVCVAIKNKVAIYELTPKLKIKYEKKRVSRAIA